MLLDEKYRQSVCSAICYFAVYIPLFFHNCIPFRSRSRTVFLRLRLRLRLRVNRFGGSGSGSGSDQNVSAPAAPAPAPHPWYLDHLFRSQHPNQFPKVTALVRHTLVVRNSWPTAASELENWVIPLDRPLSRGSDIIRKLTWTIQIQKLEQHPFLILPCLHNNQHVNKQFNSSAFPSGRISPQSCISLCMDQRQHCVVKGRW